MPEAQCSALVLSEGSVVELGCAECLLLHRNGLVPEQTGMQQACRRQRLLWKLRAWKPAS